MASKQDQQTYAIAQYERAHGLAAQVEAVRDMRRAGMSLRAISGVTKLQPWFIRHLTEDVINQRATAVK